MELSCSLKLFRTPLYHLPMHFSSLPQKRLRMKIPENLELHQELSSSSINLTTTTTAAMASSSCWKCLRRQSSQLAPVSPFKIVPMTATASFSTTPRSLAGPKKTPGGMVRLKGFSVQKKVAVKTGKPPMPGERKAMRKRIVLSNTNALPVEGLNDLSKDMDLAAHRGKVVGIPGEVVDSLRAVEAFKVTQGWGMFRRPALLIREESVSVTESMKTAEQQKANIRLVIDGARGTGKSLMLLHAMATAFVRGWIVLSIPDGTFPPIHFFLYQH